MTSRPALLIALAACALAGCASSMSKDECRAVDWKTVGYEDGASGQAPERIGDHRRACAEYGIAPDLAAYRAGREQGLREFCQPHNGWRAGSDGRAYYGSCPVDLAPAFERAYDQGHELYVRTRRVTDTEYEIEWRRNEIFRREDALARGVFYAVDDSTPKEYRVEAVLDAKQSAERIVRLKGEIRQLEKDKARYEAELEAYRATVASLY